MSFLTLFCAADNLPPKVSSQWTNALLTLFFEDISITGRRVLCPNYEAKQYCREWGNIACHGNVLKSVDMYSFKYGDFNLRALPPSTELVEIVRCEQEFEISIRSLPRNLGRLNLQMNKISGVPDLTVFPPKIYSVNISENQLVGPITLTHLPSTLSYLRLGGNRIRQHTVWYDHLPERIAITLSLDKHPEIKWIRAVDPENAVKNKETFTGIPANRIF